MIGLNKKEYSYKHAKDIETLIQRVKSVQEMNSDIINISYPDSTSILLIDIDVKSKCNFHISQPNGNGNEAHFIVQFYPASETELKAFKSNPNSDGVITFLNTWLGIIRKYNAVSFTEEEYFQQRYEQEFFDLFEIVDEDSEIAPFDLPRQLLLDNFYQMFQLFFKRIMSSLKFKI